MNDRGFCSDCGSVLFESKGETINELRDDGYDAILCAVHGEELTGTENMEGDDWNTVNYLPDEIFELKRELSDKLSELNEAQARIAEEWGYTVDEMF
jgi:uncharacterized Zn finger protein (UPF0148 family)